VSFGGQGNDSLAGGGLNDHLYGGAGNDTLNGQGGNDWLEGNADDDSLMGGDGADTLLGGSGNDVLEGGLGNDQLKGATGTDTYTFAAGWGSDSIEDSDGQGSIQVQGIGSLSGTGVKKVAVDAWQTDDKRINYTRVSIDSTHNDLIISFSDRTDTITLRNWSDGQLGLSLPGTVTPPVTGASYVGDFAKLTNGTAYVKDANGNYASAGAQANAQDVITGSAGADLMQGLGGNDALSGGAGDDVIEGGDGDDALFGGLGRDTLNGGAGRDVIIGSGRGGLNYPSSTDATPIVAQGIEWSRGFSWVMDFAGPGAFVLRGADPANAAGDEGNIIDVGSGVEVFACAA
jgi:Ca2+-binding RTX toxin-like protein